MALINCPECSKDISDQATACPNCGHPMVIQTQNKDIRKRAFGKPSKPAGCFLQLLSLPFIILGFYSLTNTIFTVSGILMLIIGFSLLAWGGWASR